MPDYPDCVCLPSASHDRATQIYTLHDAFVYKQDYFDKCNENSWPSEFTIIYYKWRQFIINFDQLGRNVIYSWVANNTLRPATLSIWLIGIGIHSNELIFISDICVANMQRSSNLILCKHRKWTEQKYDWCKVKSPHSINDKTEHLINLIKIFMAKWNTKSWVFFFVDSMYVIGSCGWASLNLYLAICVYCNHLWWTFFNKSGIGIWQTCRTKWCPTS